MAEPRVIRRVLGTAGHIDHGKTALVRALTGVDTDRLPEERRRGITIELGFAAWRLADDVTASVVDVPGHERFLRTMVAGAAGIDAVLLVVAADDGVMPQTREHLAVCELLGVRRGIVVVTKADLVDADLLALVREDVRGATRGTFLEQAPVVACSAETGAGIAEVRDATLALLRESPARGGDGPAFLPVDRVFTKAGFGTVVTGTLLGGRLAPGDDVDLLPGPRGHSLSGLKVRGLEVHGAAADEVTAGTRVAVNLRGVEHEQVRRGDVVAGGGRYQATMTLIAEVRALAGAPVLREGDELSLHLGAASVLARVTPLGAKTLPAGATGFVRVTTTEPVVGFADQRLVLRRPGLHGQGTVAGGRVLDPRPAHGKGAHKRWTELSPRLASADGDERMLALVVAVGARGAGLGELAARFPPGADASAALGRLAQGGRVLVLEGGERRFVDRALLDDVERRVMALTRSFHEEHPLVVGISSSELETRLPPPLRGLTEAAVVGLTRKNALAREGGAVRLSSHKPRGQASAVVEKLERVFAEAQLTPPLDEEARKALGIAARELKEGLGELKRRGRVARLGGLHFHVSALDEVKARVRRHFESEAQLTTPAFKALAGNVSRKYAIPLLEWLDAQGVTRRDGDVRRRGR